MLFLNRGMFLIIWVYNCHHSFTSDVFVGVVFDYVFNLNENGRCLGGILAMIRIYQIYFGNMEPHIEIR